MASDECTDQQGESIINYVVLTREYAVFLKTDPMENIQHLGDVITINYCILIRTSATAGLALVIIRTTLINS